MSSAYLRHVDLFLHTYVSEACTAAIFRAEADTYMSARRFYQEYQTSIGFLYFYIDLFNGRLVVKLSKSLFL